MQTSNIDNKLVEDYQKFLATRREILLALFISILDNSNVLFLAVHSSILLLVELKKLARLPQPRFFLGDC